MSAILVIDDDASVREVVSEMLRLEGHEVTIAENGREATTMLAEHDFDLVITDLIMPDKEGLELIREMKAIAPDAKIIAMSGGGFGKAQTYLKLAEKFGAVRTFIKPIDSQDILSMVKDILGR